MKTAYPNVFFALVVLILSKSLASCGGSGGTTTAANGQTTPQITTPANTTGPAIRVGLVGNPYEDGTWLLQDGPFIAISSAVIWIDGKPPLANGPAADYSGEVALLNGVQSVDVEHSPQGLLTVDRMEINHLVDGPIEAIDLAHSRMTILGQAVLGDGTSFAVDSRVTVSGYLSATGEMVATRLVSSASSGDLLVSGFVHSPDGTKQQFSVGGLLVDYAGVTLENFPAASPLDGDRVMVRGNRVPGEAVLTATALRYLPAALAGTPGATTSLHALVTSAVSPSAITVDGHPVQITEAALKACPFTLTLNTDITLEGELQSDGTVLAQSACPTAASDSSGESISGPIDTIDPNFGTLRILGMTVQPSITTLLKGVSSLAQLQVGDFVSASVRDAPVYGSWNASRLDLTGVGASHIQMWFGEFSVADPWIYIGGHPFATDDKTTFHITGNATNEPVSMARATFFAGPKRWPGYDKICTPSLALTLTPNADGSWTVLLRLA